MLTIHEGDALACLREMASESAQTCITSPPYFGLRDYGSDEQIGLEATPDEYVANLVAIFREVKRVLRDDGTLWLNLGDSYAANGGHTREGTTSQRVGRSNLRAQNRGTTNAPPGYKPKDCYKPKDLMGIPWMVAFALRSDGWYLRSEIIWHKPNPMPESVTDRPTKAHEQVFLLSKQARYYYDADVIREEGKDWSKGGPGVGIATTEHYGAENGGNAGLGSLAARYKSGEVTPGRNRRSVWTVATQPYVEAHFATFPPKLIEPMVLAGSARTTCAVCGAAWKASAGERTLDTSRPQARRAQELAAQHGLTEEHFDALRACGVGDAGKAQVTQSGYGRNREDVQKLADEAKAVLGGYSREYLLARPQPGELESACEHDERGAPGVVLDPFAGSGTTLEVALANGRDAVGIELNPEYVRLIQKRLDAVPLTMFDAA